MVTSHTYTIALDAMGGDVAPAEPVHGAVLAAQQHQVNILLVGDEAAVKAELSKHDARGLPIQVIPSEGVIVEGEHPAWALRQKPRSSIGVAAGLVRAGKANAMVSMGSTGATMAASVFAFGLFPGLERPAIGGPFNPLAPKTSIIDLGTHVDCKPSQLVSFAALGAAFARVFYGIERPRVGLLSVGAEEGKGNKLTLETYPLLQKSGLNFVGNVEGNDFFLDKADVIVCDGFTGNVLLKYTEGMSEVLARYVARQLGPASPVLQQLRGLAGVADRAGGPLFGVNGVSIIGHGRSKAETVANAIAMAKEALDRKIVEAMRTDMAEVLKRAGQETEAEPNRG